MRVRHGRAVGTRVPGDAGRFSTLSVRAGVSFGGGAGLAAHREGPALAPALRSLGLANRAERPQRRPPCHQPSTCVAREQLPLLCLLNQSFRNLGGVRLKRRVRACERDANEPAEELCQAVGPGWGDWSAGLAPTGSGRLERPAVSTAASSALALDT